ncbi:hypothetical protein SLE2022_297780 [Rubroshorea leprosula]
MKRDSIGRAHTVSGSWDNTRWRILEFGFPAAPLSQIPRTTPGLLKCSLYCRKWPIFLLLIKKIDPKP